MATIFEQLDDALAGTNITVSVDAQVGSLGAIGATLADLAAHPPSAIGDFGTALAELPMPGLDTDTDLLASLGSIQDALPTDIASVTGELTAGLGTLGGTLDELTALLAGAIEAIAAVAKLADIDLRCAPPATDGTGASSGAGPSAGAGGSGNGGPPPPSGGGGAGGATATATPPSPVTPTTTAPLDGMKSTFDELPADLDVAKFLELLNDWLSVRKSFMPAILPVFDEVRDPLATLTAWKAMSQVDVATNLGETIAAAAALIESRLDGAFSPLAVDLAGVAPQFNAADLATTADGIVQCLEQLAAAVDEGDISATIGTITALNGFLDDLDAARAAFSADVTPKLPALLEELGDIDGRLEDALVLLVSALAPAPMLGFVEPLSQLVLQNAAQNPITEFQESLGGVIALLQNVTAALDLSAVKAPVQSVADTAHETLDAFDSAVAGVTVSVNDLFSDIESLVDAADTGALVVQLEQALGEFEAQLETQLTSLFAPVRTAIGGALGEIGDAVDGFDLAQIVTTLQDVMTQLQSTLEGAAAAAQEIADALQQVADQIENVSFTPITDEVVHSIDEVTAALQSIDTSQLTPPLQIALQGALMVLPEELDTEPIVVEFGAAIDASAAPGLDELRGQPQRLLDAVKAFEPAALVGDALSEPWQQLVEQLDAFQPSALLEPVKQQLNALKDRLKENVDPAKALEPLELPFQTLMSAFDALDPADVVKPLQDAVEAAIAKVLAAVPVDETFDQVDAALGKAQEALAIGESAVTLLERIHEVLSAFEDAPAQTAAWLEDVLAKVDAAGANPSLAPHLTTLSEALDHMRASALTARVDTAVDPVLTSLTAANPHTKLASIVRAKNHVPRALLNAMTATPERTAMQTVLDRFDPLSDEFAAPFESLRDVATALTASKTQTHALLTPAWDDNYTGAHGLLAELRGLTAGPQIGQSVRDFVEQRFVTPMNAFFAMTEPCATAVDAIANELQVLVADLNDKVGFLVTGPGSLGDIKDTIEALVDRLHHVDLGLLTSSLNELFANVRMKLEALDPATIAAAAATEFDELLAALDLSQALPPADVAELDADYQAIVDKLAQLDPKKLVIEVVQPTYEADVQPLLLAFDLSVVLDALLAKIEGLEGELSAELERVNEAYQEMRAAIPAMDLGDVAGAALAAVGDLAGSVEIGF